MRRRKDAFEVEQLRAAAELTAAAFRDAARSIRPGTGEWVVEAALDGGFRTRGAWGPAFPTIVAGGRNATTLHYIANDRVLQAGELLLLDAGARLAMYCGDISRTFPVSGAFSPAQRRLYDVVLEAHGRAIAAARPGATIGAVHDVALRALVEGLRELGCLDGATEALLAEPDAWRHWYPHRTSHWLGLDVHDAGAYVEAGRDVVLEPGMVFTVEPGLYLSADAERCPPPLRGTGIRIEDDVLITEDGHEVLTGSLPSGADEVTDLMS
jgi:Xaa-Pro aminopeptidase